MPTLSFVILTYNSSQYIHNLLNSLFVKFGSQLKNGEYEIIVVDNNSTDTTVEIVEQNFDKKVQLFKNPENSGFAKGINIGSKIAKGTYVLFVNPDAEVIDGEVSALISVFNMHENAGVVGGRILNWQGKDELSAGKFYTLINTFLLSLGLEEVLNVRFSPKKIQKVDFVSGGFMMVKKEVFKKFGGLDENLFMYIEDMEFCYRIKKKGFETYFCPGLTIRHIGQGSSDKSFAIVNIYKGLLYFYKKHMGFPSFLFVALLLKTKAATLVILGKLINNKYLSSTYAKALKA
jgi:GT2 family glycosyltransferase